MSGSQDYYEKRRDVRVKVECPATLRGEAEREWQGAGCINLSASGILLRAHSDYPVGSLIKVQIQPQTRISPGLIAEVEVIRREYHAASRSYHIGARITEVLQ